MCLKPLPSCPLCHHKAFAESVSIHPHMGAAGAAAIPGEKGKRAQFTRHNSLNAFQPVLPALTAETSSTIPFCTPKYRGVTDLTPIHCKESRSLWDIPVWVVSGGNESSSHCTGAQHYRESTHLESVSLIQLSQYPNKAPNSRRGREKHKASSFKIPRVLQYSCLHSSHSQENTTLGFFVPVNMIPISCISFPQHRWCLGAVSVPAFLAVS